MFPILLRIYGRRSAEIVVQIGEWVQSIRFPRFNDQVQSRESVCLAGQPENCQFFLPMKNGRMALLAALLIGLRFYVVELSFKLLRLGGEEPIRCSDATKKMVTFPYLLRL